MFIAIVGGSQCTAAITEAAQNGMKDGATFLVLPNLCIARSLVSKEVVGGDGSAADDWWAVNAGAIDINDPSVAGDAFVAWARATLQARGIDPAESGSLTTGVLDGWTLAQALQIAGALPGGLSRSNLVLAQRAMDMTNPLLLSGMRFNMDGNDDAFLLEGGVFQTWDAAQQVWVSQGGAVDVSGRSASCAWGPTTNQCG